MLFLEDCEEFNSRHCSRKSHEETFGQEKCMFWSLAKKFGDGDLRSKDILTENHLKLLGRKTLTGSYCKTLFWTQKATLSQLVHF